MVKLSSSSPNLNMVARDLALDSVLGMYSVGLASHIPGISNVLPDHLSRLWAPEAHGFPSVLRNVPEVVAPPRDASFWKSATPTRRGGAVADGRRSRMAKDGGGTLQRDDRP